MIAIRTVNKTTHYSTHLFHDYGTVEAAMLAAQAIKHKVHPSLQLEVVHIPTYAELSLMQLSGPCEIVYLP